MQTAIYRKLSLELDRLAVLSAERNVRKTTFGRMECRPEAVKGHLVTIALLLSARMGPIE